MPVVHLKLPRLEVIAKRLARVIPEAVRPPPKTQKSWRGLKVGQRLELEATGEIFRCTEATNEAAMLEKEGGGMELRLTNPKWREVWKLAGRKKK